MNEWWTAAAYLAAGTTAGVVVGVLTRRLLDRPHRRLALRQAARPTAALLFWLLVAAGVVAAVASNSPETLDPIPSDILHWLPRAGVAGLLLIAGYVFATLATAGVGRAATRATGRRQPVAEATTRAAIFAAAGILALSQLGIDTTILNIVVAALAFGIALALAGIATVGGRQIARSVAAGRSVADILVPGTRITLLDHTGAIERVTATHVVICLDNGDDAVLPLSATDHNPLVVHSRPTSEPG
jgi:hypothetical protein